jgi:hypothetical protein
MITFILPLSSFKDINIAVNILFPSIYEFFDLSNLEELLVILNKKDFNCFNLHLKNLELDYNNLFNIKIIDENNLYSKKTTSSYYLQMLLKLLISNNIKTQYYLTLDADTIFTKKSSESNFFNDKAFYHKINVKDKWLERSEKCLHTETNPVEISFNINQTPFVFKTDLVKQMIQDIDVSNLILKEYCSEYTLYLTYLVKNNLFEDNYINKNFTCQIINQTLVNNDTEDIEVKLNEAFLVNDDLVITCIQSRTNTLNILVDVIKMYISNITFKKLKIGMITVVSNGEYFKRYEEALFIKKDYCKYYNYDFIIKLLEYCDGWDKLLLLYEKLNEDYDYIMTCDADVVITNRDKSIDELILNYDHSNIFMLITKDFNSLNSGNIIWKNCQETKNFLKKVLNEKTNIRYTLKNPFKPIGIYEQPSIIYIINKEYEYYKNKIKIIPQYEMNSYMPIVCKNNSIDNRGKWEVNDFLIHFAGFNYSKDSKLRNDIKLEHIIKKFCNIYKIRIIQKEGRDYGNIK